MKLMAVKTNKNIMSSYGQLGISLIEMMIAVLIGLILLAGVSQIYLANKQAYRLQESISYVNGNARYAVLFLQESTAMTGYKGDPSESDNDAFPSGSIAGCGNFDKGQYINSGSNSTDLFCIKMKAPDYSSGTADFAVINDCVGEPVAAEVIVTTRFFISANNELSCATVHSDGTTGNQPLISDISINPATDVMFGVDSDDDKLVNDYKVRSAISNWDKVLSVNINMDLNSDANSTGVRVTTDGNLLQKSIGRTIAFRSRTNPLP